MELIKKIEMYRLSVLGWKGN